MKKDHHPSHESDIGCLEAIEGLYAWLDNEIDDADSIREIEEHIRHCQSCYSRAEMEKALTEHIRKTARTEDSESNLDSLKSRVHKILDL
jgi:anti-sigma factor (TIGR02949 family)